VTPSLPKDLTTEEHIANLRACLDSKDWLEVRGVAAGDLPGETLADTFRRELRGLETTE
jgi:hypothetical protein